MGLNFEQEKREANFRYSLVRIRENAESIAFFAGEQNEIATLKKLLGKAVDNVFSLMITERNLGFFQSYYQYLIGYGLYVHGCVYVRMCCVCVPVRACVCSCLWCVSVCVCLCIWCACVCAC